jgi:hypothetical protein
VQFKEQGGKVQVLLYSGYDEVKQVPRIKRVGSFDKYTYKPSPGLLDKLSAQQRDELEAEWQRRRQLALGLNRQHYLNTLVPNLQGACESLRNQARLTHEEAERIWEALEDLTKAMRQAGHLKPTRSRPGTADPQQPTLLE